MTPAAPTPPGVSYVMPVYNETAYIDAAIDSVLGQVYEGEQELVLALGPSTDGTSERVERRAALDARIRIVRNPEITIAVGLNRAILAAQYDVIVRVDAHTELAPGYTATAVGTLERTGAASLGGLMVARGRSRFQSAVARAYNSRLGLGGGAYHGSAVEGPAESAYLGIMRRPVLVSVGMYDEGLKRAEDWELSYRLRRAGHTVWLDPALRVTYWPRDTLSKLVRQFHATGIWRGELVRRHGGRHPLRYFAPPTLVVVAVLSLVVMLLQATGVVSGWPALVLGLLHLGPVAYLLLLLALLLTVSSGRSLADRGVFALVIATMHASWGAGFLQGVAVGARGAVDRSRVES